MSTPSKDIIAAYGLTPRDVDIAIKALITMVDGNLKVSIFHATSPPHPRLLPAIYLLQNCIIPIPYKKPHVKG